MTKQKSVRKEGTFAPAPEGYNTAIATALGQKNTDNGVGILLGGRKRLYAQYQRKAYANFAAQIKKQAKRQKVDKNTIKPHQPELAKLGRHTAPNIENRKRKYQERQAAVCDKLKAKLEERRIAAKAKTQGDITILRADGSVD